MWGVADVFSGWGRGNIASVGSTEITVEEFQRAFQNELEQFSRDAKQKLSAEQGKAIGLDRRVVSQLLGGAAIESHAHELGLALSDKSLIDAIQNDPDFKGPDGKFSMDFFRGRLRQAGLSEQKFLSLFRKDELRTHLIGALVKSVTVPKPMLDLLHAYNEETRVIEFVTIDADKAVTVPEPDDAKLKERYEAAKTRFMTPEYRKFEILTLSTDDLKKQFTVTDDEVAKSYEETKASYDTPEQRRVQQIAFKDKATAEAAQKTLADGSKTFADVAKDAGAKDTDVDLGMVTKKALIDPKIAGAAFALEKDKFSNVVEGRFATVVLRVTQIEPGITKTLADVKEQVRDKLLTERAKTELQKKRDEVDDNRSAGKTLKDIAETLKLSFQEIAAADRQGGAPDGKAAMTTPDLTKIVAEVFAPDAGTNDQGVELASGASAWINLLGTEAPKQRPFEEVKADVKIDYVQSETLRLVSELATKLTEKLNAGEAITAIEGAAGAKSDKTSAVTRLTQPQGLSEAAVAQAFVLAKGKAAYAESPDKTSRTVFRVTEVTPAPVATTEQTAKLTKTLEADLVAQTLAEYTEGLKRRYKASINEAEMRRALGTSDQ